MKIGGDIVWHNPFNLYQMKRMVLTAFLVYRVPGRLGHTDGGFYT